MSPTQQPHALLNLLYQQLEAAKSHDNAVRAHNASGSIIQVPGMGKKISSAYEQLRNAAEYTEEHLLLQRAIRRFYKRNVSFSVKRSKANIGHELIVELTQAGYLRNGDFSSHTAANIDHLVEQYIQMYASLREARVARDEAADWVLSILAVESESMLNPHSYLSALAQVGYQHFATLFPRQAFLTNDNDASTYEISLFIAVHQALLKSDIAIVRHELLRLYQQNPAAIHEFVQFNRQVTVLFTSRLTQRLKRAVSKHGAPLRILKSMVETRADMPEVLRDQQLFLNEYDRQVNSEYTLVRRRLNKGIIKSIIFILITKVIIGVGIEVPYDLIVVGSIAVVPLAINLLVPPLYMASLKLGLKVPAKSNAQSLHHYIDAILYRDEAPMTPMLRGVIRTASAGMQVLYGVLFFIPFAIMVYVLWLLKFNPVQMIIFFVFLSTASFLGFRLSSMIRELELVGHQSSFLSTVRDFFYLPFILVGQWLSGKYARINAVAHVLDIFIELPLKTALRLVRQWTNFLNEKHDELY